MTTLLPTDADNKTIPAVRLRDGAARTLSVTGTSARNSTAFHADTRIISLYATGPVYIRFGTANTVTATSSDHYFPAGIYYDIAIGGGPVAHYGYIAALKADADCTLYISEKE